MGLVSEPGAGICFTIRLPLTLAVMDGQLALPGNGPERPLLMVRETGGHRLGLVVDELLHQQRIVIKSMEATLWKVDGIAAATILGDGTVGLILDVTSLVGLVRAGQASPRAGGRSDLANPKKWQT